MRRGSHSFFYEILKDVKNNIDTMVEDLDEKVKKNQLKIFELPSDLIRKNNSLYNVCIFEKKEIYYKSTWKKSKLPDLKKLKIINYGKGYKNLQLTYLGQQLLTFYNKKKKEDFEKLLKNIIGTYNYKGFRPYAFFVKTLYKTFGTSAVDELLFSKILSHPINKTLLENRVKIEELKHTPPLKEAVRPKSYIENFLYNSGLAIKLNNKSFKLTTSCDQFIKMYFSDQIHSLDELGNKELSTGSTGTRRGQKEFRDKVLAAYNYKCAVTGCELRYGDKYKIDAAHVFPVCAGGSNDVTNGIPMLKHIHQLFDSGAFTIIPPKKNSTKFKIKTSKNLRHNGIFPTNMELSILPSKKNLHPSILSVKNHNEFVFNKGVQKYCSEINNN